MRHFNGYLRNDGSVGTRNFIGIVSSVICSSIVVNEVSREVESAIPIVHSNGCAQLGDDFKTTKNMLVGVATNPNLYASLLIGLGCETNQISGLLKSIPKIKPLKGIGIQQLAGGSNTIESGISIANKWNDEIKQENRVSVPISKLNIGIATIDVDEDSLLQMAPIINRVVKLLTDNEVNVVFGLTDTMESAGDILLNNTDNKELKQKLNKASQGSNKKRWKTDKDYSNSDFTKQEKLLGEREIELIGKTKINNILEYNGTFNDQGLYLMKSSQNIAETLSGFSSVGCNMSIILSRRGVFSGSISMPSMTICSEKDKSINEFVDYKINKKPVDEQVEEIIEKILSYASGEKTVLEEFELGDFSIPHVGTTF